MSDENLLRTYGTLAVVLFELFKITLLYQLIDDSCDDKRSSICSSGLGRRTFDCQESVLDGFHRRSRIPIRSLGENLVGVFGVLSIAAEKFHEIGDGFLFLVEVNLHRIGQRSLEPH